MRSAEWLKQHIENTQELSQEALDAVSDFTLMWALFEASEGQQMGNRWATDGQHAWATESIC
ncbi:TPA: hypothetical protein ACPJZ5_004622 [Vibrio diabolicus]